VPGRKPEEAARTRGALEDAARELFETRGFVSASAEEIVAAAGVTRGALYHHYAGKEGVFEVVAEAAMKRLHDNIVRAAGNATDPVQGLKLGARRFLELSSAPRIQRLLFIDAPVVLGWQRWRELDTRYGLGLLLRAIEAAVAQRRMRVASPEMLAHLLLSAMIESSMLIANSPRKSSARAEAEELIERLIDAFCLVA
jgi:AcrR family transcriptional regulator